MTDNQDNTGDGKLLHCNFCGKSQHEVRKLIAGPLCISAMNVSSSVTTLSVKNCRKRRTRLSLRNCRRREKLARFSTSMSLVSQEQNECSRWQCITTTSGSITQAKKTMLSYRSQTFFWLDLRV